MSHSGEAILKAAAETSFAAGVAIEGASHEFLSVDTGPGVPRKNGEIQYQDIELARRNADKARAMERIRRINTPILHIGRDQDHLQGIFKLAHEWMLEAGKDSTWVSFDHPDHGYPLVYRKPDGSYAPGSRPAAGDRCIHGVLRPQAQALVSVSRSQRHAAGPHSRSLRAAMWPSSA